MKSGIPVLQGGEDVKKTPSLMAQGRTSDSGKSTLVAAFCRIPHWRGVRMAPFKPRNMALNAAVTVPGEVAMQPRLSALGTQTVTLPEGDFRGHTFHYSKATAPLTSLAHATPLSTRRRGEVGEAIYRQRRLTASYPRLYFPSNPVATAHLFPP